jgi:DNA repair protein RecO (recombination protein O)
MLVKTEAIVLKSMRYRDTSRIVTFYTKEFGKLKCIAKGARTAKNKFGSALEPMTLSMLVFYKKDHRDIHLISQCDAISPFKNLTEDLDRLCIALGVIELINQVTHDEEKNPVLFGLLLETLSVLNTSTKNYRTYLFAFQLRLAMLFGFSPNLEKCGNCGTQVVLDSGAKQFGFQIARGAVFCSKCFTPGSSLSGTADQNILLADCSAQALQILRRLTAAHLSSLGNIEFDSNIGNEIDALLRLYLRYHFDGLKPLKSTGLFNQY